MKDKKVWTRTLSGLENTEPGFLTMWMSTFMQKVPLTPQYSSEILNKNNNESARYVAPIAIKYLYSESICYIDCL